MFRLIAARRHADRVRRNTDKHADRVRRNTDKYAARVRQAGWVRTPIEMSIITCTDHT